MGGARWAPALSMASRGPCEQHPAHPWGSASPPPRAPGCPTEGLSPARQLPGHDRAKARSPAQGHPNFIHAQEASEEPVAPAAGTSMGMHRVQQEGGAQSAAGTGCISKAAERLICKINPAKKPQSLLSQL